MKVLSLITLLVVVAACSNDPDQPADAPQGQGEPITLTAAMPGGNVQTRIGYVDSDEPGTGVSLTWTADDAFLAYNVAGERSLFTLSTGADSDNGTFTGTAPDATSKFNVFFPTMHTYKDATDSKLYASLAGQTQTGNKSMEHLAAYSFMRATVEDITQPVMFHHLLAMMRFDLTLTDYDAAADGAPVLLNLSRTKSDGTYDFGDKLQLGSTAGAFTDGNSLQLTLRDIDLTGNSGVLRAYLMVPPFRVKADNQLIITVTCAKGTVYRFTAPSPAVDKSYEAGMRYRATCTLAKAVADASSEVTNDTQPATSFAMGTGTKTDPYIIQTAAELISIKDGYNSNMSTPYYYKLATDIRVTADSWKPIGRSVMFKGVFDGGGHTISGELKIGWALAGFFGMILEAEIRNLHITADVTSTYVVSGSGATLGALAASVLGSKITHCSNSGKVTNVNNDSWTYTGGLVGHLSGSAFTGCINRGSVSGGGGKDNAGTSYIGGIAGYQQANASLQNCYNYGNISINDEAVDKVYMGGIAGSGDSGTTLTDCTNHGTVTGAAKAMTGNYTGGLYGGRVVSYGHSFTLHNCSNRGTVIPGTTGTSLATGSLVGSMEIMPINTGTFSCFDCCFDASGTSSLPLIGRYVDSSGSATTYTLPACPAGHIHRTRSTQ